MAAVRVIAASLTVLALVAQARGENDAQRLQDPIGTWRFEAAPDADAQRDNVTLASAAVGRTDATFSLRCRPAVPLYDFAIRDPRLASLAAGAEATLSIRYADAEPTRWQVASRGDGSVVVQEVVHQTAFTLILASLKQATADTVEFAIDNYQWAFRLDGFAPALEALVTACGFEPGATRQAAKERAAPGADIQRRNQLDLRFLLPPTR